MLSSLSLPHLSEENSFAENTDHTLGEELHQYR